ncbi:MAG TPA: hypothetical protein VFI19_11765, partial [Nocardioides sp.]|nr:hypothetical protein [Nocardioides sp.]
MRRLSSAIATPAPTSRTSTAGTTQAGNEPPAPVSGRVAYALGAAGVDSDDGAAVVVAGVGVA